jgi:UDP-3-O-[3-hydroxymyristoyl] glucosamine N-acyltransferase
MKARDIAELVGGELRGNGDIDITSIADISSATEGELAFLDKDGEIVPTNASCLIAASDQASSFNTTTALILVSNPKLAFAKAAKEILPWDERNGWDETAVIPPQDPNDYDIRAAYIGPNVSIGKGTYVGEGCIIHAGVQIGENVIIRKFTVIHPNCVIYDNVEIGYDCVLHAGVVIGAAGFGYVRDEAGEYHQFPQIGSVEIGDNVEIGANTCVDRGALGKTTIGDGTKIDNLVQIGHNVQIGKRCVIAAQTGISGSTVIEDDCVIGGQVGFGDHARVKSGAVIGSQAGILPGKIVRPGVWWGTPIQPLDEYKRQNAHVKSLGRLRDELKELKRQISELLNRGQRT